MFTIIKGSSPLARGLRPVRVRQVDRPGIIPARAGFTSFSSTMTRMRRDHPRSRGVYHITYGNTASPSGSSPLARGLRAARLAALAEGGIIPARAGFTTTGPRSWRRWTDHPRSRGVYSWAALSSAALSGSSPLARGLPRRRPRRARAPGIIPARAGFTRVRRGPARRARDHPRSRGVYALDGSTLVLPPGSSPLARGLLGVRRPHYRVSRIIPARAGFTILSMGDDRLKSDHPRSRGVYDTHVITGADVTGSSPLARGLHL